MARPFYVTTPIYYVNDRPHIGHCYTTIVGDAMARFARLERRETFFLTGTDEHAEKVVESASAHAMTPLQWADRNAAEFQKAFALVACEYNDFMRTTQTRHTEKVTEYVRRLLASGDVYLGEYEGWWDASQEEYLTETVAKEANFLSPVSKKPLVRRKEKNYFFRLSKYESQLRAHIESNPGFILPEARRNEILGRIRAGLQDVPVSRAIDESDPRSSWGIRMPGDPGHRIYVWIDALFNYLSAVDVADRRHLWPAQVHVMAKDIVWFHAVIWPCMLMALGEGLPGTVYAHSYWIREGVKMSKSLGNFIDLTTMRAYIDAFGVDAWRWFMLTEGPLGATDSDFVHAKFVEVYNADLANGIGNAASRVGNMIEKYFGGKCPDARGVTALSQHDWPRLACDRARAARECFHRCDLQGALSQGVAISRAVDGYIHATEPFKMAKDESKMGEVGAILYHCAEALRIAATCLLPAMPAKMSDVLRRLGQEPAHASFESACTWGVLKPGTPIVKGEGLFPRADPKAPPPEAPVPASDAGAIGQGGAA